MKQIINISLSGIAFTLERDGYEKLKRYFSDIEREYNDPSEAAELISDIETRITELILNKQSSNTPVTEETIDTIIAQMGFPKNDEEQTTSTSQEREPERRKITHRLYRNPKGAMLGGVCNGLATYFNIDPVVVRLLFIILPIISLIYSVFITPLFTPQILFTSLLIYISLWIIVPKARTPRQILEMQGNDITKDTIETFIKEELVDVQSNISRITKSERPASVLSSLITVFGTVLKVLLYIFGIIVVLGICGGIIIVAISASVYILEDYNNILIGSIYLNSIALGLIGGIPLILILLGGIKLMLSIKIKFPIFLILILLWISAMIYGTIVAYKSTECIKRIEINCKTIDILNFDD